LKIIWVKFALDLFLWIVAVPFALFLRLETIPLRYLSGLLLYLALSVPLKAFLIWIFNLPRQYWSAVGMRDLFVIAKCVFWGTFLSFALVYVFFPFYPLPRSVPLIEGLLALLFLGGLRFGVRFFREYYQGGKKRKAKRILVAGAGEAGIMIAREMLRHPESGLVPVGFLDDDPAKRGQLFLGLRVLGKLDELPRVVREHRVEEVLIALPSAPGEVVRRVFDSARAAKVPCRAIPGVYEILSGKVTISQIREVNLEDLLRREPVRLDLEAIGAYLQGKVVLVTGAGGSIGREIARQLTRFSPKEILLFEHGENSLFEIEMELKSEWPNLSYRAIVGDTKDRSRLEYIFEQYRPQVVFHAAAYKHVPMMELNPSEAVFNNVLGTKNLVEVALEKGVERFVNISTDKAVNPSSVMGATKRVAEYIVQWAARRAREGQVFVSVRFGNVLGSRGSVVPVFQELIRKRKPITITHPEMKRYFMTIGEAVQLVLQAGGLGDNGSVYVLDMGEPIKIVDLAKELVRLSGLDPDKDVEITYTGIRPGEKLFEEILSAEEGTRTSRHEKIFIARNSAPSDKELEEGLLELFEAARSYDEKAMRRALKKLVPTYKPFEGAVDS